MMNTKKILEALTRSPKRQAGATVQECEAFKKQHEGKKDYYAMLGVKETATGDEINNAFRNLLTKFQPNKNPGHEEIAKEVFKMISEAYDTLLNPESRTKYDQTYDNRQVEVTPKAESQTKRLETEAIGEYLSASHPNFGR